MGNKLLILTAACVSIASGPLYSAQPGEPQYFKPAEMVSSQHRIKCEEDVYELEYVFGGAVKGVDVLKFTQNEVGLPHELDFEIAEEFSKYSTVSSFVFMCGVESNDKRDSATHRSGFVNIDLRGRYRESVAESLLKCRESGWNFDHDTRRKLTIKGGVLTVDGEGIGHCFGDAEYFSLDISISEGESK